MHSGLVVIEKVATLMNISDMLTKPVSRQILRRCLALAESWRAPGAERLEEEHSIVEDNMVMLEKSEGTALVRHGDQCPRPDDNKWSTHVLIFMVMVIASIVIYIWRMMKNLWNKIYPRTRTVGTQSQTFYTALARHATPRLYVSARSITRSL